MAHQGKKPERNVRIFICPECLCLFWANDPPKSVAVLRPLKDLKCWLSPPWGHNKYIILLNLPPNYCFYKSKANPRAEMLESCSINDGERVQWWVGKRVVYSGPLIAWLTLPFSAEKQEDFWAAHVNIHRMYSDLLPEMNPESFAVWNWFHWPVKETGQIYEFCLCPASRWCHVSRTWNQN